MYKATVLINAIEVTCWGETLDNIDRMYIVGDVTSQTFNPDLYEQIKAQYKASAVVVPF